MTRHVILCGAGASKQPILQAAMASAEKETTTQGSGNMYHVRYADPPPYPCAMVVPTGTSKGEEGASRLMWVVDADAVKGVVST